MSALCDRVVRTSDQLMFGIVRPTGNGTDQYRWTLKKNSDPNGPDKLDPPAIVSSGVCRGTEEAFRCLYHAIADQGELVS